MKKSQNLEYVVQTGLGVIIIILFLLTIIGMYQIRETNQSMSNVVYNNQLKVELAHEMRDSIRLREIGLNKMLAIKDPFERDEELIRFYEYAGIYRNARAKLLALPMDAKEKEIYVELTKVIRVAQPLNKKAAELISIDSPPSLIREAVQSASSQQQILLNHLNQLVKLQNDRAHKTVHIGTDKYDQTLYLVIMFGVIAILGALYIVRKVSKLVAARNQELAIASEAALTANKTKSAFLATMSHEIRTPLTAIIGFAETLLDSDQKVEQRISAIKTIVGSGKHLLQIINDILDISKIEANKLELEELEISPVEILTDVEAISKPLADSKGIMFKVEYEFPIPKTIISDPLRLKQILINLTSNAIKFTETGHVKIEVKFNEKKRVLSCNVFDSGIGMSQEQMEHIFDAFTQADSSTTRKYGGTGLGLSLSKELAQQLGGDILVKSLEGTGSQFKLVVNTGDVSGFEFVNDESEIPELEESYKIIKHKEKYKGRILLAEDNEVNQQLVSYFINNTGASLSIAGNGKIALEMAGEEDYDLIFMDMQMPVLGGVEAIKQLRKGGSKIPIYALTANAMKKDKECCFKAGCDGFLTKPIDRNELYRVIDKYLQKDTTPDKTQPKIVSTLADESPRLADIIEIFCEKLPDVYSNIKQLEKEKDWSELNNVIHNLKGTSANVGYPMLSDIARKIEFHIASEDYPAVKELITKLGNIISQIITPKALNNKDTKTINLFN